jgi:hypothetical protein
LGFYAAFDMSGLMFVVSDPEGPVFKEKTEIIVDRCPRRGSNRREGVGGEEFMRFAWSVGFCAFLLISLVSGCGGKLQKADSTEAAHIGKVGQILGQFKTAHQGANPKNIDDLRDWAIKNGKGEDSDFVSTRDKQPYVIEPMAMMRMQGMDMGFMASKLPVIVHETTGKNGMRYVLEGSSTLGSEMNEEGLKYLTKGKEMREMKDKR